MQQATASVMSSSKPHKAVPNQMSLLQVLLVPPDPEQEEVRLIQSVPVRVAVRKIRGYVPNQQVECMNQKCWSFGIFA